MRSRSLVPLERKHVYAGISIGLGTATVWFIGAVIKDGFTLRDLLWVLAVGVVALGVEIVAQWRHDNKLEFALRRSRRIDRGTARPKRR